MSTFTTPVTRDMSFLQCDWCGKQQDTWGSPKMAVITYEYEAEGSHGSVRTYPGTMHFCPECVPQMASHLKARGTRVPGPRTVFIASCACAPNEGCANSMHATRAGATLEAAQRAIERYGSEDRLNWSKESHGHGSYWSARGSARGPNMHMEYVIEEFEVTP